MPLLHGFARDDRRDLTSGDPGARGGVLLRHRDARLLVGGEGLGGDAPVADGVPDRIRRGDDGPHVLHGDRSFAKRLVEAGEVHRECFCIREGVLHRSGSGVAGGRVLGDHRAAGHVSMHRVRQHILVEQRGPRGQQVGGLGFEPGDLRALGHPRVQHHLAVCEWGTGEAVHVPILEQSYDVHRGLWISRSGNHGVSRPRR